MNDIRLQVRLFDVPAIVTAWKRFAFGKSDSVGIIPYRIFAFLTGYDVRLDFAHRRKHGVARGGR